MLSEHTKDIICSKINVFEYSETKKETKHVSGFTIKSPRKSYADCFLGRLYLYKFLYRNYDMARLIIQEPSRAISELNVVGYDRLIALPGHIPRNFSSEDVDLSAPLTRYRAGEEPLLKLHYGVTSSPMQAVYSPQLNIDLARMGCFSISNCSQPIERQAGQRRYVRNRKAGFITPTVVHPEMLIGDLAILSEEKGYSTFPVTADGTLNAPMIGGITSKDYDVDVHGSLRVKDRMIPRESIVVAYYDDIGEDLHKADAMLKESHHGSIPLLRKGDETIVYMIFRKDVEEHRKNPHELVDRQKRYLGGDAINTHDYPERVPALMDAGSTFLYITTSQGYTDHITDTFQYVQNNYPGIPVGAGNIATKDGFLFLAENGAACVGIGMGPGSICKTQQQIGVGRGQATAIKEVAETRDEYYRQTGIYVPIIGDGGFSTSRDFVVGYALGADLIMAGKFFAATDESPTEVDFKRSPPSKPYWGEGSDRARLWMEKRYGHMQFEEGVEGWVEYVGPVKPYLENRMFAVKDGLRKAGCRSIKDAHENAVLEVMSKAASAEGRPHDIMVGK